MKQRDVQKQRRIGHRIVGHLDVRAQLVVQENRLVQRPQAIAKRHENPEWSALQRAVDSVPDRESRCHQQQKKIGDPTVLDQQGIGLQSQGDKHFEDENSDRMAVGQKDSRRFAPIISGPAPNPMRPAMAVIHPDAVARGRTWTVLYLPTLGERAVIGTCLQD